MKISVVIVTKNREHDVLECVGSLLAQSVALDELIIIDNASTDQTASRVKSLKSRVKFPIRVVTENRTGFPILYNRGIREAAHDWVAFIDDDCVADLAWFSEIKNGIKKFPKSNVLLGKSVTYYSKNPYGLATQIFQTIWKLNGIDKNNVLQFDILDNKNIVYKKSFLKENNLEYDETRAVKHLGASEDSELGLQIGRAGGRATYLSNMLVKHKDPSTFTYYFKKLFFIHSSRRDLRQNWQGRVNKKVQSPLIKKHKFMSIFSDLKYAQQLTFINSLHLFVICFFSIVINKFLSLHRNIFS